MRQMVKSKGISLIVLVITILVLAILAATVIISLNNTNIIDQASDAVTKNNLQTIEEAVNLKVASHILYNRGNVDVETLLTELNEEFSSQGYTAEANMETNGITMSNLSITVEVSSAGIVTASANENTNAGNVPGEVVNGNTALELFDANLGGEVSGYKANKLQIGDFVDYDAGNWGETVTLSVLNPENEPNATAGAGYTGASKPSTNFGFGGFAAGASKNGNAVPYKSEYNYLQTAGEEAVIGWRVFDVNETTGVVTLISAGCPEAYYHPYLDGGNYAYVSEYILAGTEARESYATTYNMANSTNYKPRDWGADYAGGKGATNNVTEVATGAKMLAISDLVDWYTKYMDNGAYIRSGLYRASTADGFGVVNGTQYDNLVNNYAYTWLASAYSIDHLHYVSSNGRYVNDGDSGAYGVRPLVYLASNILFENGGTKTLKDAYTEGNTYTYNVWNIVGKQ